MTKVITLNGTELTLQLKVKDLPKLGMVVGDIDNNLSVVGTILGGIVAGDILALINFLEITRPNALTKDQIDTLVENATPEEIDEATDTIKVFFKSSPLTSKVTRMALPALEKQLAKVENGEAIEVTEAKNNKKTK